MRELLLDVGANCDWLCMLTSLLFLSFLFANSFTPGNMWRDWRFRREHLRRRQQWYDDWDDLRREWREYQDAGGHGPPPAPIPLPEAPPVPEGRYEGSDPLMKFYKFYQDVATIVGGPEKKHSIHAGGKV